MTPTTETSAIEREVRIEARPETIFPFFTDPELFGRWSGVATLDPRPGGIFRNDVNGKNIARGEYVTVDPPHSVTFTWGWEAEDSLVPPGSSTVHITLTPDGDHTVVRLVHSDLPSSESAESHGAGWEHYLERLRIVGAGGDPGPDSWAERATDGEEADRTERTDGPR
jgi:uncharacterized protein YndB with AHSA1/START domain